ncbi:MAG TPA: glycine cleavage system protein GcvH [Gammaproteobacteria bacterium]|nr:glycine cleavage system protein GcvH [Gammaproteobacteria bacterium]
MNSIPKTLKYSKTHEWVRQDDEVITVGITDHAQCMLGDLVYVELPDVESSLELGQECAVVESVKAAADIYCPVSGEIVEINESLFDNPQLVNEDPYGKGWLFRIRPFETHHRELLTPDEYTKQVASEAH